MGPPIVRILEPEMRRRFNEGRYLERVQAGDLLITEMESRHPSLTAANEPFCTHSKMLSYTDLDGTEVARVHQYVRPDGSIGASGSPDPKRLFEDGILYRLVKARNRENDTTPSNTVQNPSQTESPENQ